MATAKAAIASEKVIEDLKAELAATHAANRLRAEIAAASVVPLPSPPAAMAPPVSTGGSPDPEPKKVKLAEENPVGMSSMFKELMEVMAAQNVTTNNLLAQSKKEHHDNLEFRKLELADQTKVRILEIEQRAKETELLKTSANSQFQHQTFGVRPQLIMNNAGGQGGNVGNTMQRYTMGAFMSPNNGNNQAGRNGVLLFNMQDGNNIDQGNIPQTLQFPGQMQ
jgi:hypothetical protein